MDKLLEIFKELKKYNIKEGVTETLLLAVFEKKTPEEVMKFFKNNPNATEREIQFWLIKERNSHWIGINKKLDLKLCEFIYVASNALGFPLAMNAFKGFGKKLKIFYDDKILKDDDIEILKDIYIDLGKHNYLKEENHIKELERIIKIIEDDETEHVIKNEKSIPEKFCFLDTIETIVVKMEEDMIKFLDEIDISSYTRGQLYDDFYLMIKILHMVEESKENKSLLKINEETFCDKLNLIYYNPDKHWQILKQWLLDKGCPEKYIGQFSLRFNALYAMDMMINNPDITIKDMLKDRGLI